MPADKTCRTALAALFALTFTFSAMVNADETRLICIGEEFGTENSAGEPSTKAPAEFGLRVMQKEEKTYLALASEAYIEASLIDGVYTLEDVPNVLGTRSLSYDPSKNTLKYIAVLTRHGKPQSAYHFSGNCLQAK